MSKFKVGDKVVSRCIGGTDWRNYLVKDAIYIVIRATEHTIDILGHPSQHLIDMALEGDWFPSEWDKDWSNDWFKLADEQLLSNAFDKAVEEVGETFVAESLIEKETEMALTSTMNAEQIRDEILRIDVRIEEAKRDIENAETERNSFVEKLREKGFELSGKMQVTDGGYNVCTVDNVKEGDILILTEESWNNDIPSGSQVRVIKNDFSDLPLKIKTLDGLYEDWTKIDTVKFK